MTTENRLNRIEWELGQMASRLRRLEVDAEESEPVRAPALDWSRPAPKETPATHWQTPTPQSDRSAAASPSLFDSRPTGTGWRRRSAETSAGEETSASFEEMFGGRVLAWIGGLAILLGAVLFMGMAVRNGWLGEEARTVIAVVGSLALLVAGIWLHEKKGRSEAARAAVASAISGLFGTIFVAAQAYELISPELGLAFAALIAGLGFLIAVRWSSSVVAAIGSLGALGAPILTGLGSSGASIAFFGVALAATVAILVWQRWDWLALGAFLVSAPQLIVWTAVIEDDRPLLVLPVLVGFWALYLVAAFGYELRTRDRELLPISSWLLVFGSCALVVMLGFGTLQNGGDHTAAVAWVFGFAAVHLSLGLLSIRIGIHRELGSLLIGAGVVLSAFGLAQALEGPALVAAWAGGAAVLAFLATRLDATPDPALSAAERMLLAAVGFLALAIGHTLIVEAPPKAIFEGVEDLGPALGALAACAAASLCCWFSTRRTQPLAATAVAFAGAVTLVYLGSVLIVDTIGVDSLGEARQAGQVWLSAFWTVSGLGAVVWGLWRRSADVRLFGLGLLGVAIVKVWTYDLSELDELARVLSFVGLGLLLLVGAFAYQRLRPTEPSDELEPSASA